MDIRQFKKNPSVANKKPTGCVPKRVVKPTENPNQNEMKTFSGNFSKTEPSRNSSSAFGIWSDQSSAQMGKEKVLLNRKQEQKRRIAIEAIKLAEQRKRAMMERQNIENQEQPSVVSKVKPKFGNTTRRALFSLDSNQPAKSGKTTLLSVKVPKLPPIKETEIVDLPKRRAIVKANPLRDTHPKTLFIPPLDLMKGLKLEETVNRVIRYSIEELKEMNPLNSKFKDI